MKKIDTFFRLFWFFAFLFLAAACNSTDPLMQMNVEQVNNPQIIESDTTTIHSLYEKNREANGGSNGGGVHSLYEKNREGGGTGGSVPTPKIMKSDTTNVHYPYNLKNRDGPGSDGGGI